MLYATPSRPLEYYLDKQDLSVRPAQRPDCCILVYSSRARKLIWGISPSEMQEKIKAFKENKLPVGV